MQQTPIAINAAIGMAIVVAGRYCAARRAASWEDEPVDITEQVTVLGIATAARSAVGA